MYYLCSMILAKVDCENYINACLFIYFRDSVSLICAKVNSEVLIPDFFPSRDSGRGYKIGPVCVCVCVCVRLLVSALTGTAPAFSLCQE